MVTETLYLSFCEQSMQNSALPSDANQGLTLTQLFAWLRPGTAARRELNMVLPVARVWLVLFFGLVHFAPRRWEWYGYMLMTHVAVGICMTAIWFAFYGQLSWKRFVAAVAVVFGVAMLMMLYLDTGRQV